MYSKVSSPAVLDVCDHIQNVQWKSEYLVIYLMVIQLAQCTVGKWSIHISFTSLQQAIGLHCSSAISLCLYCIPQLVLRGYLGPIMNTTFIRLNKAAYLNSLFSSSFPRLNLLSCYTIKISPLFLVRPLSLFGKIFEGQQPCSDVPVHVVFDTEYNGVQ